MPILVKRQAPSGLLYGLGKRPVFLPNFTITLLYHPNPNQAKFRVPLNFSKLDLHDYLYHAYNLKVQNIRSVVTAGFATLHKPAQTSFQLRFARAWRWVEGKKYMIVDLDEPFVWPKPKLEEVVDEETGKVEMKENFKPWGKAMAPDDHQDQYRQQTIQVKDMNTNYRRSAQELLNGERQWRPTYEDHKDAIKNKTSKKRQESK